MSLPGDLTKIIVTGSFLTFRGNIPTGTVMFTPSATLTDTTGKVVVGTPTVATLNGSGQISVAVACTDNANFSPATFTYTVTVALNGSVGGSYPAKSLPHTLGSTIDLTALLP